MDDFDFWLGEWHVTDPDGGSGRNSVRRILGGAVLEEDFHFEGADGSTLRGRSHTVLVPGRGWCQTWVDDQGGYLDLVGGRCGGSWILSRPGQRMVFCDITAETMTWLWERETAEGCVLAWRLNYRRTS